MLDDLHDDNDRTVIHNPPVTATSDNGNGHSAASTWPNQPPVRSAAPTATHYYKDTTIPPPPPSLSRESAARERMRRRRVRGRGRGGEWAWVIIAAAMFGVVVIISMSFFLLLRTSQETQEVIPTAAAVLPTPVDARSDFSGLNGGVGTGQQITLDDGRSIILQPWDGQSRFTVLLMGLDRRPGETGLAYRTDTMLLVSIDPIASTIGLLSIPRDLYVEVPGYSALQRVNSPMVLGEIQRPGYGPTLAMQTVQWNLGMRVHDYLAVDFNAFVTLVDAIGGVDIDVPYNISDPQYPNMYYGYDPFYLRAGLQHLDGNTALKYARTRHGDSDFQRAQRQQQVLYAIRDRVLNLGMLPQMIVQAPTMWNGMRDNVYTGLTLDQLIQLAWYLKDIPQANIHTGVVDGKYTLPWMTPEGASVLVPDRARIGPLMVEVFGTNYSE
jgi:polyisoprenyl-teichoic acid--peptidoglycan teichoic acid transferase